MEEQKTPEVAPASPVPGMPQKKSKKKLIIGGIIGALLIVGIALGSTSNFFGSFTVFGDGDLEVTTSGISDDSTMLWAQICTNGMITKVDGDNLMAAMTGGLTTNPQQIVGDGESTEDTGDVELETGGTNDKDVPSGGDMPTTGGTDSAADEDVESAASLPEADMTLPSAETFDDPGTEAVLDVPDAGSQVQTHVEPDLTEAETEAALNVPEPESQVQTHVEEDLTDAETEMAQDPDADVDPAPETLSGAETTQVLQFVTGKIKFQVDKKTYYEDITVDNGGCTDVSVSVEEFDVEEGKTYTAYVEVKDNDGTTNQDQFRFTMPGGKDLYVDGVGENDINPDMFVANLCGEGTDGSESVKINWNTNGVDDIKGVSAPTDGNCKSYYSSEIDTFGFKAGEDYTVNVTVDYHEYVDETNESNNTDSFRYTAPEGPLVLDGGVLDTDSDTEIKLPDLFVSDIYLDGSQLTILVKNQGEGDVPSDQQDEGHTYIYIDNELEWTYSWETLKETGFTKAGGSAEIQPQTLSGTHLVQACVDALDVVNESDEKDNCTAVKFDAEGDDTYTTPDVTIEFNKEIADMLLDTNNDDKPDYSYALNQELVDLIGTDDEVNLEVGGIESSIDEEDFVVEDDTTTLVVDGVESAVDESDFVVEDDTTTLVVDGVESSVDEEDFQVDEEDTDIDFGPVGTLEHDFPDVEEGAWYEDAVAEVADLGIMTGNDDGTFDPGAELTRAAIAKIAVTAFGYELQTSYDAGFSDVNSGDWFEDYVNTAEYYGIISGYSDGTFRPGDSVNRAEGTKVLIGAIINHITDADYFFGTSSNWSNPFSDVSTVDWFYESVMQAVYADAISGYDDGTFKPANTILRAEVAKVITVLLDIAATPTI